MISKLLNRLEVLVRQPKEKRKYRANSQGHHHWHIELDVGKEIQCSYYWKGLIFETPEIVCKPGFTDAVEAGKV
jgi:hypothetical protein